MTLLAKDKIDLEEVCDYKLYPIADKFIVQWESMKELYPKADFGGWIY